MTTFFPAANLPSLRKHPHTDWRPAAMRGEEGRLQSSEGKGSASHWLPSPLLLTVPPFFYWTTPHMTQNAVTYLLPAHSTSDLTNSQNRGKSCFHFLWTLLTHSPLVRVTVKLHLNVGPSSFQASEEHLFKLFLLKHYILALRMSHPLTFNYILITDWPLLGILADSVSSARSVSTEFPSVLNIVLNLQPVPFMTWDIIYMLIFPKFLSLTLTFLRDQDLMIHQFISNLLKSICTKSSSSWSSSLIDKDTD